jgi:hypothetical protein
VRLVLKVVMPNDRDFVDIILLYFRFPYFTMLKYDILNAVTVVVFNHVDKRKLITFS